MNWILPNSAPALHWIQLVCGVLGALLVVYAALAAYKANHIERATTSFLRTQAEEAERKARQAETVADELEKKLKARTLTEKQKATLLAALRKPVLKVSRDPIGRQSYRIYIRPLAGPDTHAYAREFVSIFTEVVT